jgi:hypothetical protein
VQIGRNQVGGDILGQNIKLEKMPASEVDIAPGEPLHLDNASPSS